VNEVQGVPRSSNVGSFFVKVIRRNIPIVSKAIRVILGSDIYCKVPANLILPHPYGITIHHSVALGENVVIMPHVTIGSYHYTKWGQAPIIEDDVYIGAGAVVLGAVTIGRGARIGANAVVTKDVPPGKTVVGANRIVEDNVP
jgi:serine acetyltransferase